MIKAIETQYQGYRFRSRTEARWAVFFDWINVKWEYETQGFALSDGTKYLPDFYLPKFNSKDGLYVEVKAPDGDFSKARQFAKEVGDILLADGVPDLREYTVLFTDNTDPRGFYESDCCFDGEYLPHGSHGTEYRMYTACERHEAVRRHSEGVVYDGLIEARGARFEFGQNPVMDRYGAHQNY